MKKRKVVIIILSSVVVFVVWYLFIKPYDYVVTFKSASSPGVILERLDKWNETYQQEYEAKIDTLYKKSGDFNTYRYKLLLEGKSYEFTWSLGTVQDSITRVKIGITDQQSSLVQRIRIPFLDTDFEQFVVRYIKELAFALEENNKKYKVKVNGLDTIPEMFYVYTQLEEKINTKQRGMLSAYNQVFYYLESHDIKMKGVPFVEITNWELDSNKIQFRFGVPINKQKGLPPSDVVSFGHRKAQEALKATFNGNYRVSHNAWYALIEYANNHSIPIAFKPIEIFHNNPHSGKSEIEWKAEIYMPLKYGP